MKTFSERVLACALSIPKGRVTTYGHIARAAGGGNMAAQSITSILSKAEKGGARGIPYHRIVYSGGKIWTSSQYDAARRNLYKKEGIIVDQKGKINNFLDILYEFQ